MAAVLAPATSPEVLAVESERVRTVGALELDSRHRDRSPANSKVAASPLPGIIEGKGGLGNDIQPHRRGPGLDYPARIALLGKNRHVMPRALPVERGVRGQPWRSTLRRPTLPTRKPCNHPRPVACVGSRGPRHKKVSWNDSGTPWTFAESVGDNARCDGPLRRWGGSSGAAEFNQA